MIAYCHENKSLGFRIVDVSASRPYFQAVIILLSRVAGEL